MIAAPGKKIILIYASSDENWKQRLQNRLVTRANDRERFPAGLNVEAWSKEDLIESRELDKLRDELPSVAAIVFLVSADLLGFPSIEKEIFSIVPAGRTWGFPMYRVFVRPTLGLPWLGLSTQTFGSPDKALSLLTQELCDAELNRMADTVIEGAATNVSGGSAAQAEKTNIGDLNETTATRSTTEQVTASN